VHVILSIKNIKNTLNFFTFFTVSPMHIAAIDSQEESSGNILSDRSYFPENHPFFLRLK